MLCIDRACYVYLSHYLAPGFQWEVPAPHCPSGSTLPGTERGEDPAGVARRSHVTRKRMKKRKPRISAPLSVPGGSPEPCLQRWIACLWTAPPPVVSASCPERRSTQMPHSCGAAHRGLVSAGAAGADRRGFGLGPCFPGLNLSPCPRPCCWKSCCCPAPPEMEPGGAPGPGQPLRCPTLHWWTSGAVEDRPPWQMSWREMTVSEYDKWHYVWLKQY